MIVVAEPTAAHRAVTMTEFLRTLPDDASLIVGHASGAAASGVTLAAAAAFAGRAPDADAPPALRPKGSAPRTTAPGRPRRARASVSGIMTTLADSSDLARASFAFGHSLGRPYLFAGRRPEGLARPGHVRPQFGHMTAFGRIGQKRAGLPETPAEPLH